MFRFEELQIWRRAVDYGKEYYRIAQTFPAHEKYSLSDQLRRAGLSISNNIAEGSAGSAATFRKYLLTSIGSTLETVNILNFAFEIQYVKLEIKQKMYSEAESLIKMIRGFSKTLK